MLEPEIQQDRRIALLLKDEVKTDRLEKIIRELITEFGLDLTDQHFEGTPGRVARLYRELTRGYRWIPRPFKTFNSKHTELIVVSDINFPSSARITSSLRVTGRHDCVAVRGVKCPEAQMSTVVLRGLFREKPSLVEESHQDLTMDNVSIDRILESGSGHSLIALPLLDLGWLRSGAQFLNLAVKHMIGLETTTGVSH